MKKKISVIGGGASALMLGCMLDTTLFEVNIYERNAALARKFLVAGDGGLNLTHSESESVFLTRYTPSAFFKEAFTQFTNRDFINWLNLKNIPTYIGSSGRVFPHKDLKPVEVLNILLNHLKQNKVNIHTKWEWKGFSSEGNVMFENNSETKTLKSDYVIFCMGGASWPVTGSKGDWVPFFEQKNIKVNTFEASNCSFKIKWPSKILPAIKGKALKNCKFSCGTQTHLGEAVLTSEGIEGSGVYPLSPQIRQQLGSGGEAKLILDLKPQMSLENVLNKLSSPKGNKNISEHLVAQLNLNSVQLTLIKNLTTKEEFTDVVKLAFKIKNLELIIFGCDEIENAISTVGGIDLNEITNYFELKKLPQHFTIGEMLDYDAPTGGYLLQSCFSMAHYLAIHLNSKA